MMHGLSVLRRHSRISVVAAQAQGVSCRWQTPFSSTAATAGGSNEKTLPKSVDVVVVGGGIAGSSAALALASAGKQVLVLEQNRLTSGSTWHAAGLVAQLKHSEAMVAMAKYSRDMYAGLEAEGEYPIGWHQTGSLGISRGPVHWQQLQRGAQLLADANIEYSTSDDYRVALEAHPLLEGLVSSLHEGQEREKDLFTGAVFTPTDGIVNPSDACMAIVSLARKAGARFVEHCGVTELLLKEKNKSRLVDSVTAVRTTCGQEIFCENVILACGQWTKQLAAQAGVTVPTAIVPHEYAIFDRIQGVSNKLPVVRDYMRKIYIKPEVGGLMVGAFEYPHTDMPPKVAQRNAAGGLVPADAADELYEESLDKLALGLESAMELAPQLGEVGIKQWVHGPDTHSVDHDPILGRAPFFNNLFVATGFNSQGIQTGPGVGAALATWVLHGNPSHPSGPFEGVDFSTCDVRRFHPPSVRNSDWTTARALEGYAKEFGEHPPLEQWESGRGVRLSELHQETESAGAVFGSIGIAGWERPLHYEQPTHRVGDDKSLWRIEKLSFDHRACGWLPYVEREHKSARESVALFDLSSFGKISVSGTQATRLLDWCMSSNVPGNTNSQRIVNYTQMLNDNGGIESDLTAVQLDQSGQEFYLVTGAATCTRDLDHLRHEAHLMGLTASDVKIEEITDQHAVLALMGPQSRAILSKLVLGSASGGDNVESTTINKDGECHPLLSNESFPFGSMRELFLDLSRLPSSDMSEKVASVRALRVSYAGELGWELHIPRTNAKQVFAALKLAASTEYGIDLPLAGYRALLECLRIEKAYVHFGHDVTPKDSPLEAGLGFVSASKLKTGAPFKGREALLEQKAKGVSRRLVTFSVDRPDVSLWGHEGIYRDGKRVGHITSGGVGFSANEGRAIGMGYVENRDADQGLRKASKTWINEGTYELAIGGEMIPAKVHFSPIWDPKGSRARA